MKKSGLKLGFAAFCFLFCNSVFSQGNYSSLTPIEHVTANLIILSGSSNHTKTGAKLLSAMIDPDRTNIFDLAALKLSRLGTTYPDTNAWLIKALLKVPSQRYLGTLQQIQEAIYTKNKSEKNSNRRYKNNKTLKELKSAIATIKTHEPSSEFLLENVDFDKEYAAIEETNSKTRVRSRDIDGPDVGDNLSQVYKIMGVPNLVDLWGKNVRLIIPIGPYSSHDASFLISNFSLTYEGFAIYHFHRSERQYTVKNFTRISTQFDEESEAEESLRPNPYREQAILQDRIFSEEVNSLVTADPLKSLIIAKKLVRRKRYNNQFLDLSAQKIWLEIHNKNGDMANAIAHLARFIGESKNGRYVTFLKNALEKNPKRKARKHIKRALNILPKKIDGIEQYTPPENQVKSEI